MAGPYVVRGGRGRGTRVEPDDDEDDDDDEPTRHLTQFVHGRKPTREEQT